MLSAIGNAASFNWLDPTFTSRVKGRDGAPDEQVKQTGQTKPETDQNVGTTDPKTEKNPADKNALSEDEQREVEELKQIDRKVRQHEMQHVAVGGSLVTSGANYSYKKGPDGQNYAVAGEVSIDTSKGRTPEETLSRARRIRNAALAPADPSPQDRSVAAMAGQMEMQAMREIAQAKLEESKSGQNGNAPPSQETSDNRVNGANAASAYQQASHFGQSANNRAVSVFA